SSSNVRTAGPKMYRPLESTRATAESISFESCSYCSLTSLNSIFEKLRNACGPEQEIKDLELIGVGPDIRVEHLRSSLKGYRLLQWLMKAGSPVHQAEDGRRLRYAEHHRSAGKSFGKLIAADNPCDAGFSLR